MESNDYTGVYDVSLLEHSQVCQHVSHGSYNEDRKESSPVLPLEQVSDLRELCGRAARRKLYVRLEQLAEKRLDMLYRLHDETAEHNDVQKEYDDLKVEIYEAVHQIEALRPLPLGSRMLLYVVRKLTN